MNASLDPRLERGLKLAIDLGERAFSVLLFAAFAIRMSHAVALRPWDALILVSEGLVVVFIVIRRGATLLSVRPLDWLVALVGTAAPMLLRGGGHALAPPAVSFALMLTGLLISIWGKLILRRSFGLGAANRGVVHAGPYGVVRHPIYAGYILVYTGFLLDNPIGWNVSVLLIALASLVIRILAEEKVLAEDPAYAAFMTRVRFRLAPGVF